MGLRELLILLLILAIVVVVLRGLFVALRSRRGQIKIVLEKNVPEYDLEELEMRELPNGGARMVERSFAEVLRQNSAHAAKANATASGKPSTLRPGAKGLKTNLSRSGARTATAAAAGQAASSAAVVKSTPLADEVPVFDEAPLFDEAPATDDQKPLPELDFEQTDEPVFHAEVPDYLAEEEQGANEQPRYEDQDDPAGYERALVEDEEPMFDEDPVFNFVDDDSHDVEPEALVEEKMATNSRQARNKDELDDVLDELLQTSVGTANPRPGLADVEKSAASVLTWEDMSQADDEPEPEPEYEPEPEPEPEPEIEPEYEPEPQHDPEPQPEPVKFDDELDSLLDYSADDEGDDEADDQNEDLTPQQQADSQSDPSKVEDDMPDFDNEYLADPEPQPEEHDSFGANLDDEMDVLFDDDDRERRIAALEEQQDSAPKRFMSWVGGAFGRSGSESKVQATEQSAAHQEKAEKLAKADKKARKKLAKAEKKQAQKELDEIESVQQETDFVDEYMDDDDGILSVREKERPGAAERAQAEKLTQSQLDLGDESGEFDDAFDEVEERSQEPPAYSEVLVINVMARQGTDMAGDDLLPVLMSSGLKFGEMSIFHRHTDKIGGRKNGPVMFSVANALNPGTFDLNRISEFSTLGVCFFMTLPNVVNNMMAFEQMLATARKVQAALDAELKDDNRSVMTAQTVEHYRQRIRDFELQELKNTRAR